MPHRWSNAAELRRYQIEAGLDLTFVDVFEPMLIDKILSFKPKYVIEVGAGTGHLSKALSTADSKISVTAIEPSEGMYEVACDVLSEGKVELINCCASGFKSARFFDVAVSHLVAHSVEDLFGFLTSINNCVSEGGVFLFSIPHPCFYNDYKSFFNKNFVYMDEVYKEVSFSITKDPGNVISSVPYYHRPISHYISTILKTGFILEGLEETYPSEEIQVKYGEPWKVPRYCVFTCRKKIFK